METLGCAQPLLPFLMVEGRGGLCHAEGLSPEAQAGLAAGTQMNASVYHLLGLVAVSSQRQLSPKSPLFSCLGSIPIKV